jgi:hypothetical protein
MCYDLFLDKTKFYFAVLLAMKTYNKAAVFIVCQRIEIKSY